MYAFYEFFQIFFDETIDEFRSRKNRYSFSFLLLQLFIIAIKKCNVQLSKRSIRIESARQRTIKCGASISCCW